MAQGGELSLFVTIEQILCLIRRLRNLFTCCLDNIIPIPGTTSIKNLEENWASNKITVTAEENKEINELIGSFTASGNRYPDMMQKAREHSSSFVSRLRLRTQLINR